MASKHTIIILSCLLLALPGFAAGFEGNDSTLNLSYLSNGSEILSAPDIQSILNNPEDYLGKMLELKGVVSRTYPGQDRFSVADRVGCSLCKAKISQRSITVHYSGKIPKYMTIVHISGPLVQDTHQEYVINATSVVT